MFHAKYRILRELGRGGEGTVYLVRHLVTEQLRAAKVLKNSIGDRRFQEVNAMKRLNHPSLPQIYDVLEEEEQIWLIMEYVKGRNLQEIPVSEITIEQFFSIAGQLSEVLVYLHSRTNPVLHLDIKPSNLLLRDDGTLVLIDFGAAIRKDTLAFQDECFGTPGFAAPEQFDRGMVDERSDIYGAGAVLYYFLYRIVPGNREISESETKKGKGTEKRFKQKRISKILEKCLYTQPDKRFQSAAAFRHSVRQAARFYDIRKKGIGISAAVLFFLCVVYFAVHQLVNGEIPTEKQEPKLQEIQQKQYRNLLAQADQLGFEQALACYREASMCSEGDGQWAVSFIERISEDYSFTLWEEEAMKQLLFEIPDGEEQSVLEQLQKKAEQYEEFAYHLGIAYWHYYEGTGGRSAAADWFGQAAAKKKDRMQKGGEEKEWDGRLQIYARISTYYRGLGRTDENGLQQTGMEVYWTDLNQLWKLEGREKESLTVQSQLSEEILSCVIFHMKELLDGGIEVQEIMSVLNNMKEFCEKNDLTEVKQSCITAEAAAERVLQDHLQEPYDMQTE